MSYQTLSAELTGTLPGLPFSAAQTYIRRAWTAILGERLWTFLMGESALYFPVQITAGTVTLTQFSPTVTCDTAATAALSGLANPAITARQFRAQGGPLYNIVAAAGNPLTLTLDRPIEELSGVGLPYQVYQAYFPAPVTDFLSWTSAVDYLNGIAITGKNLTATRSTLDLRDPQRQSQGLTFTFSAYKSSSTSTPLWEAWPHPTQGQAFEVSYRRQGVTFALPTDTQPYPISDDLILKRALVWDAYPWAQANRGAHPTLKSTDFLSLIREKRVEYNLELVKAKRLDDEIQLQRVYDRGHTLRSDPRGRIGDAKYWQAHPITW